MYHHLGIVFSSIFFFIGILVGQEGSCIQSLIQISHLELLPKGGETILDD
ncbi:MAG: hypothetical protein P4L16_06520 [Chlamydiales bacterium]|nr:hypothetical protein [Chlamydiales bacterium]